MRKERKSYGEKVGVSHWDDGVYNPPPALSCVRSSLLQSYTILCFISSLSPSTLCLVWKEEKTERKERERKGKEKKDLSI